MVVSKKQIFLEFVVQRKKLKKAQRALYLSISVPVGVATVALLKPQFLVRSTVPVAAH